MTYRQNDVALRRTMVDTQLRPGDVTNIKILSQFLDVPRHLFVPDSLYSLAYSDQELRLPSGCDTRALIPPALLARMLQAADPQDGENILDVGGGWGYTAALLAKIAPHATVTALETREEASTKARHLLSTLGLSRVTCVTDHLEKPLHLSGSFDLIFVNGRLERDPRHLCRLLKEGGRLLAIRSADDLVAATGSASDLGRVRLYIRSKGHMGSRPLFDAFASVLAGFERIPAFVF